MSKTPRELQGCQPRFPARSQTPVLAWRLRASALLGEAGSQDPPLSDRSKRLAPAASRPLAEEPAETSPGSRRERQRTARRRAVPVFPLRRSDSRFAAGDGVVSTRAEGVTTAQTSGRKPGSSQYAVHRHRIPGVVRARGQKRQEPANIGDNSNLYRRSSQIAPRCAVDSESPAEPPGSPVNSLGQARDGTSKGRAKVGFEAGVGGIEQLTARDHHDVDALPAGREGVLRKISRINRLARFRRTASPSFRDATIPILNRPVLFAATTIVR